MEIQVRYKCEFCKGSGFRMNNELLFFGSNKDGVSKCTHCNGKGGLITWLELEEVLLSSKGFQHLLAKH